MAGKAFRFEVITPDATVYDGDVAALSLPAGGGSIGILADHAPMVCTIETGAVRISEAGGGERYLMVGDGFIEVADNRVKLLAEVGERAEDIDLERAEAAERRALERLRDRVRADTDFERARAALTRAMTRVKIVRDLAARGRQRS